MRRKGEPLDGEPPKKRPRLDEVNIPNIKDDVVVELQALMPELLLLIFERLGNKADLQRLNRVCKQFNELIAKNYRLWCQLPWPGYHFNFFGSVVDTPLSVERIVELGNGDLVAFLAGGSFRLLPVMGDEWRVFAGHLDPYNFHTRLPIKDIIFLHHNQIATCADDGICVWNRLTGELVQHLPPRSPKDRPFRLLSTTTNHLISASPDGSIFLYPCDQSPAIPFLPHDVKEPGNLKDLFFWREEIVGEFEQAIVSWNVHGRSPTTRVLISELRERLTALASAYLANAEMRASGQMDDNDITHYHHPDNKRIEFDWRFSFWDGQVEVLLNKTLGFIIDIFKNQVTFMGVRTHACAAHDEHGNYSILHQFGPTRYKAFYGRRVQESIVKYPMELTILQPVKLWFIQPAGVAFFVLQGNQALRWDIKSGASTYLTLGVPEGEPHENYNCGSDDWKLSSLLPDDLIGMHAEGIIVIWDTHTGQVKQHFKPPYPCLRDQAPLMSQLVNHNFIVQRTSAEGVDERGVRLEPQKHVCVYRFLPPPRPVLDDAIKKDSDIMNPVLKR